MTSAKKNPFFKASDLEALQFTINGMNQTSRTPLPKGSVQLVQILEDGLILVLPAKTCSIGHMLSLDVQAKKTVEENVTVDHRTQVSAVIKEIEPLANTDLQIRVYFREHVQAQWDALIKYFSEKQYAVNKLVKETRK